MTYNINKNVQEKFTYFEVMKSIHAPAEPKLEDEHPHQESKTDIKPLPEPIEQQKGKT